MDLTYTTEQNELRTTARDFLAARLGAVSAAEAGARTGDRELWRELAELGWLAISVPEALGGIELGLIEEVIVAEESARALLPQPWLPTVGMALPLLLAAGDGETVAAIAAGEVRATLAWAEPGGEARLSDGLSEPLATRSGGETVTGTKTWVPAAAEADLLLVSAERDGARTFVVVEAGAPGVSVRELDTLDRTRPLCEVRFEDAPARQLELAEPQVAFAAAVRRTLVLAGAEAVGIGQRVLDLSCEYASERKQFGRVIGSYQGVSHSLADAYVELELSRSLTLWAALAADESDPEAEVAARAAASKALAMAPDLCERAIQVHGGIGTTWESPLHLWYRRAMALAVLDGSPRDQRAAIADRALA